MTSVRNSYIVLSSFPAFASSPHSPQKLSPLADYQTASISLLHVIFFPPSDLSFYAGAAHESSPPSSCHSPLYFPAWECPNCSFPHLPAPSIRQSHAPPPVPPPSPNKSATVPLYTQTFHPPPRPRQQYNLNE